MAWYIALSARSKALSSESSRVNSVKPREMVTGTGSLILEDWPAAFGAFTPVMAGWVIASATVGTAARFFVQTYAQSLSVHSHGVVIMVLEPMWTALFAALWFGETMTVVQVGGCFLIFLSLVVNRWASVRRVLKQWLT